MRLLSFWKGTIDQTGVIDSWPAHNARPSNMQLAITKNNNLVISNLQAEGKPDITPKVLALLFVWSFEFFEFTLKLKMSHFISNSPDFSKTLKNVCSENLKP